MGRALTMPAVETDITQILIQKNHEVTAVVEVLRRGVWRRALSCSVLFEKKFYMCRLLDLLKLHRIE